MNFVLGSLFFIFIVSHLMGVKYGDEPAYHIIMIMIYLTWIYILSK